MPSSSRAHGASGVSVGGYLDGGGCWCCGSGGRVTVQVFWGFDADRACLSLFSRDESINTRLLSRRVPFVSSFAPMWVSRWPDAMLATGTFQLPFNERREAPQPEMSGSRLVDVARRTGRIHRTGHSGQGSEGWGPLFEHVSAGMQVTPATRTLMLLPRASHGLIWKVPAGLRLGWRMPP
jgi:hypothetical protein